MFLCRPGLGADPSSQGGGSVMVMDAYQAIRGKGDLSVPVVGAVTSYRGQRKAAARAERSLKIQLKAAKKGLRETMGLAPAEGVAPEADWKRWVGIALLVVVGGGLLWKAVR